MLLQNELSAVIEIGEMQRSKADFAYLKHKFSLLSETELDQQEQ